MNKTGIFGLSILALVFLLGITWLIQGNDFFMYKFFGIKYENVRREIFEQSAAYNQGMVQELENMHFEYEQADAAHKDALAAIILHRVSAYPNQNRLPADLREFIAKLQRGER